MTDAHDTEGSNNKSLHQLLLSNYFNAAYYSVSVTHLLLFKDKLRREHFTALEDKQRARFQYEERQQNFLNRVVRMFKAPEEPFNILEQESPLGAEENLTFEQVALLSQKYTVEELQMFFQVWDLASDPDNRKNYVQAAQLLGAYIENQGQDVANGAFKETQLAERPEIILTLSEVPHADFFRLLNWAAFEGDDEKINFKELKDKLALEVLDIVDVDLADLESTVEVNAAVYTDNRHGKLRSIFKAFGESAGGFADDKIAAARNVVVQEAEKQGRGYLLLRVLGQYAQEQFAKDNLEVQFPQRDAQREPA